MFSWQSIFILLRILVHILFNTVNKCYLTPDLFLGSIRLLEYFLLNTGSKYHELQDGV